MVVTPSKETPPKQDAAQSSPRQSAAGSPRTWTVDIQAGAGIVADSNPTAEYQETLNKAQALLAAITIARRD